MPGDAPWYKTAFDADYPLVQSPEEKWTPVQSLSVETLLNLPPRARILDLGCGWGRHCAAWRAGGFAPAGLDLSLPLLRRAREGAPEGAWVRGDMRRLPFAGDRFDAAASLFASFGYFETRGEDLATLREARRVLRPGGGLYLDLHNPARHRARLPAEGEIRLGDARVRESARLRATAGGARLEIVRELLRPGAPPRRTFYSIRLYGAGAIRALLEEAGFASVRLFGDYSGAPPGKAAPRLIATARKPA